MTRETLIVENIKCGGCEKTITSSLSALPGVSEIQIDRAEQRVSFESASPETRARVADKLRSLGYPEAGSTQGLASAAAYATSFVSCAIGKTR